jgi:hypothetical protein
MALLAVVGCVPPHAHHLQCEFGRDDEIPLDVRAFADWSHLRHDVERAEEIGVRFGDSRRKAEGRTGEHLRQTECTERLLADIAVRHNVSRAQVEATRGRRPVLVDIAVFGAFAVLFASCSGRSCGDYARPWQMRPRCC